MSQISMLLAEGVDQKLLNFDGAQIRLTESGMQYLARGRDANPVSSFWILPDEAHRVETIDKTEVFLPTNKQSFFRK